MSLTPITRRERFLNALSDETQELPAPVTREEVFLKQAAESGGGGGSSVSIVPEEVWSGTGTYNNDIALPEDLSSTFDGLLIFEMGNATDGIRQKFFTAKMVFSGNTFSIAEYGQSSAWIQMQYDSDNHKIHIVNNAQYGSGVVTKIYKLGGTA